MPQHLRAAWIGVPLLACSSAAPEPRAQPQAAPPLAQTTQALMGGVDFDEDTYEEGGRELPLCSDDDKAVFRQMMLLGRAVAQTPALAECVRRLMSEGDGRFGPYVPCIRDPFPLADLNTRVQGVIDVLATPHVVGVTCVEGNIGTTRGGGSYHYPEALPEVFEIPNPTLDQLFDPEGLSARALSGGFAPSLERDFRARVEVLASRVALLWHEAMHVHAYHHDCGDQTYFESVPYMVQHCVEEVANASAARCDVRGGCEQGGYRAVIEHYPEASAGCMCVRDARESSAEQRTTPVLDSDETGDRYGAALAAADFNGDGFDDLAVGAPGEDQRTGRVYLYYGSIFGLYAATLLDQAGLDENEQGDAFGFALAAADVDLDGIPDLAVGAPGEDRDAGSIYVFRGARSGLVAEQRLALEAQPGDARGARLGHALALGRLFEPAEPTLAASAPGRALGGNARAGTLEIWTRASSGAALLNHWGTAHKPLDQVQPGDRFGWSLAFGEATPAGQPLFVGAPLETGGGRVYVFRAGAQAGEAGSSGALVPHTVLAPPEAQAGMRFGHALAPGRSAGVNTLAVAAPHARAASTPRAGSVFLFRLTDQPELLQRLDGQAPDARLGSALLAFGRSRAMTQLLATAPGSDGGWVHLFESSFEQPVLDFRARRIQGARTLETPDTRAGEPAANTLVRGDFDGDGVLDWATGAPEARTGTSAAGHLRVFRVTPAGTFEAWGLYRQSD